MGEPAPSCTSSLPVQGEHRPRCAVAHGMRYPTCVRERDLCAAYRGVFVCKHFQCAPRWSGPICESKAATSACVCVHSGGYMHLSSVSAGLLCARAKAQAAGQGRGCACVCVCVPVPHQLPA